MNHVATTRSTSVTVGTRTNYTRYARGRANTNTNTNTTTTMKYNNNNNKTPRIAKNATALAAGVTVLGTTLVAQVTKTPHTHKTHCLALKTKKTNTFFSLLFFLCFVFRMHTLPVKCSRWLTTCLTLRCLVPLSSLLLQEYLQPSWDQNSTSKSQTKEQSKQKDHDVTWRAREEGAAEEGGGGEEEEGEANKTNRKRKKKKKESVCVREGLERSVWFGTEREGIGLPFLSVCYKNTNWMPPTTLLSLWSCHWLCRY